MLKIRARGSPDPIDSLTPRQPKVLQLLAEGRSAKEMMETLGVTSTPS
jgi:DNA-binding CsgD family transcriptional regulator